MVSFWGIGGLAGAWDNGPRIGQTSREGSLLFWRQETGKWVDVRRPSFSYGGWENTGAVMELSSSSSTVAPIIIVLVLVIVQ